MTGLVPAMPSFGPQTIDLQYGGSTDALKSPDRKIKQEVYFFFHFYLSIWNGHISGSTGSPVAKGQKRCLPRIRVCPMGFCRLLFRWMCSFILWNIQTYYFTGSKCQPIRLRNCKKTLDILDVYLLPPGCWTMGPHKWFTYQNKESSHSICKQ